jgi:SAM-dependent methyltransferase
VIALSRTCSLADFPACISVAAWQQQLAAQAWSEWQKESHVRTREPSLCVNWSGCPFDAPGPTAIYQYRHDPGNGVARARLPAVYGLNVLDHIEAPVKFLSEAATVLRAGGLLLVTYAFWDAEGPDTTDGASDRRRIYDVTSQKKLLAEARRIGFTPFGGIDWTYHGNMLGDHTLASLVLTRRA